MKFPDLPFVALCSQANTLSWRSARQNTARVGCKILTKRYIVTNTSLSGVGVICHSGKLLFQTDIFHSHFPQASMCKSAPKQFNWKTIYSCMHAQVKYRRKYIFCPWIWMSCWYNALNGALNESFVLWAKFWMIKDSLCQRKKENDFERIRGWHLARD